jgi:hypothetical protein
MQYMTLFIQSDAVKNGEVTVNIPSLNCRMAKNVKIINSYCSTDSVTNKFYFVNLDRLINTPMCNSVNNSYCVPVVLGNNTTCLLLSQNAISLQNQYSVKIYNENGVLSSDAIKLLLVLSYEVVQ